MASGRAARWLTEAGFVVRGADDADALRTAARYPVRVVFVVRRANAARA